MKKILFILLVLLFIAGCSTTGKVVKNTVGEATSVVKETARVATDVTKETVKKEIQKSKEVKAVSKAIKKSKEWYAKRKDLWKEYYKARDLVKASVKKNFKNKIKAQEQKIAAAVSLFTFGDKVVQTRGIVAWQYNNMCVIYINQFEATSHWSEIQKQLETETVAAKRRKLIVKLHKNAVKNIKFLEKGQPFILKAEEMNKGLKNSVRKSKIANNKKYIEDVFKWVAEYK